MEVRLLPSIHCYLPCSHTRRITPAPASSALVMAILAIDESHAAMRSPCGCGSLLSAVAMGLNMPPQATVRPTHAMRQANHVAAISLCIACDSQGSNVANEALTRQSVVEWGNIERRAISEHTWPIISRFTGQHLRASSVRLPQRLSSSRTLIWIYTTLTRRYHLTFLRAKSRTSSPNSSGLPSTL